MTVIASSSRTFALVVLVVSAACTKAFSPPRPQKSLKLPDVVGRIHENKSISKVSMKDLLDRFDTLESAGLNDEYKEYPPFRQKYGGFKRTVILVALGLAYRWYRARFINKIPFWDRQPQWNMVVTNKEQEKALRAYTCKQCGSTIFIARNREWFFEGGLGLSGLGCYTCGAKGKDNFVMDRDRIVEEVGDDDDYFDYERPLDFVSAAERRALIKQAKGDEDLANQMLIDMSQTKENDSEPTASPVFAAASEEGGTSEEDAGDEENAGVADDKSTEPDTKSDSDKSEELSDSIEMNDAEQPAHSPESLSPSFESTEPEDGNMDILGLDDY